MDLLHSLPPALQQEVLRYRRWQDQHASLLGKLLVRGLLDCFDQPHDGLRGFYRDALGKPRLPGPLDFTISHSGTVVACAMSDQYPVGLDVEQIRAYDLDDFRSFLRPDEVEALGRGGMERVFCELWTKKESLVKAKGVGLISDLRLQHIYVEADRCLYHNGRRQEQWWYYSLPIDAAYVATLCTQGAGLDIEYVAARI